MVFHAFRLIGWHDSRIWETSLLWLLNLGNDLLVVGYELTAQAKFGGILPFMATHVFTTGGIGMVKLGMMARISLGHSGRPLQPPLLTILAFVLLNVSSLLRVATPVFFPSAYWTLILLSGSVWILTFAFSSGTISPFSLHPGLMGVLIDKTQILNRFVRHIMRLIHSLFYIIQ